MKGRREYKAKNSRLYAAAISSLNAHFVILWHVTHIQIVVSKHLIEIYISDYKSSIDGRHRLFAIWEAICLLPVGNFQYTLCLDRNVKDPNILKPRNRHLNKYINQSDSLLCLQTRITSLLSEYASKNINTIVLFICKSEWKKAYFNTNKIHSEWSKALWDLWLDSNLRSKLRSINWSFKA